MISAESKATPDVREPMEAEAEEVDHSHWSTG